MADHFIDLYETSETLTKLMDLALDRMSEGESIQGIFDLAMEKREDMIEAVAQRGRMIRNLAVEKQKVADLEKRLRARTKRLNLMDYEMRRAIENAVEEFDLPLPIKDGLVTVSTRVLPNKVEWEEYDIPEEYPATITVDFGTHTEVMETKVRTRLAAFEVASPDVFRASILIDTQQGVAKAKFEAGEPVPGARLEYNRKTLVVR